MTKSLVLRTCSADMTSYGGFVWPKSGPVECTDWDPRVSFGNGLHGALWGEGNGSLFNWSDDAVWQVVEVDEWVDLDGKVKFPRGTVVHTGNQKSATDYIIANGARGAVIGGTATAGVGGTATAGHRGTATAGRHGIATAGYRGTATAGDCGTATTGYRGTATAGVEGIINIEWYDGSRDRIATGYVGENGIEPNTAYRVRDGSFVRAKTKETEQ